MSYLLDTNICIEILRGRNSALKMRLATKSLNPRCYAAWSGQNCNAALVLRKTGSKNWQNYWMHLVIDRVGHSMIRQPKRMEKFAHISSARVA